MRDARLRQGPRCGNYVAFPVLGGDGERIRHVEGRFGPSYTGGLDGVGGEGFIER